MPSAPAIAVDQLVKVYKTVTAVDGISFALEAGSITGLLGGNGAGKTTTIAMIMGLVIPTSGSVTRARRRHGAPPPPRAPSHEFREPLCGDADAADDPAEPHGLRHAVRRRRRRRPHRRNRRGAGADRASRPPDRQAVGRPEDPGVAGQVPDQPARSPAARRADRLARSGHGRLGARAPRALPQRTRRDGVARLAQHDRGRTAVRARHHHEARQDRRRRHAAPPARPLRQAYARRGVPRRRARARRVAPRPRNDAPLPPSPIRRGASPPWCCATGTCCARRGRV